MNSDGKMAAAVDRFLRAWDNHIFTSEMGNVVQERQVEAELDDLRATLRQTVLVAMRTDGQKS